jgi:transcriptional regulator with XRE-family HTH domain
MKAKRRDQEEIARLIQQIERETSLETIAFVDKVTAIAAVVKQVLEERGITQAQLSEKLGKKPSEVSKFLSGRHNFTLRSLVKLEQELGVEILQVVKPIVEARRKTVPKKPEAIDAGHEPLSKAV